MTQTNAVDNLLLRRVISVLWPTFLVAGMAEMIFFSLFDPIEMHFLGEEHELSRSAAYTVGFFAFWILGIVSSLLTLWLHRTNASDDA